MVSTGITHKTELLKCFIILKIKVNGNASPVIKHNVAKMWKPKLHAMSTSALDRGE
jgi:hypothetical protein